MPDGVDRIEVVGVEAEVTAELVVIGENHAITDFLEEASMHIRNAARVRGLEISPIDWTTRTKR